MDLATGKELAGVKIKIWLLLTAAAVVASLLALPFAVTFIGKPEALGPGLIALSTVIALALFGPTTFIGLYLSKKIELQPTPVLEGKAFLQGLYKEAICFGATAGIVVAFMLSAKTVAPISLWTGFLASFHGSIGEELLMRLFLLSVLGFVMVAARKRITGNKGGYAESRIMWVAILTAAFAFGLWHVQAAAAISKLTFAIALKILMQNSVGGIFFGWLFWKRGIESAIIAHFSANLVLHVISPLLIFGLI